MKNSLRENRIHHAYLFHGVRGVGKATTAKYFAQCILCDTQDGCGMCKNCIAIANEGNPNLQIVETTSSIGINEIREIKKKTAIKQGEHTIWIILEAERMTIQAANSLLKILEEPPEGNIFLLVTDSPNRLLPTILSRCVSVPFKRLHEPELLGLLKAIIPQAKDDNEKCMVVARMANGSIGDAIELWDGPILQRRNLVVEKLLEVSRAPFARVLGFSIEWEEDRETVITDLAIMLKWFRDILILKTDSDLPLSNPDYENELRILSEKYSLESVIELIELLGELIPALRANARPRFILGYLLLKMKKGVMP